MADRSSGVALAQEASVRLVATVDGTAVDTADWK